jgi:hypothetical protein
MWQGRFLIYILGLGASGLAMSGYADFDPATWTLDIHPFNLREFALTGAAAVGNGLAAVASVRGWRRK